MKKSKRIDEIILYAKLAKYLASLSLCGRNDIDHKIDKKDKNSPINNENRQFEKDSYGQVIVADIACDHGYIGFEIFENGLADKVIFSDISSKSLEKARKLVQCCDNFAGFDFRIGDGLEVIRECVFLSVIAGIGGREIVKILQNKDKVNLSRFYILQTRQDDSFVRENMKMLGLNCYVDKMVKDGEFVYHTMLVGYGNIENVDDYVLKFFENQGLINRSKINKSTLELYYGFESVDFGKNNFFIDTKHHKDTLKFMIERFQGQKNQSENVLKNSSCESVSLISHIAKLNEKISVLDNIRKSAL